ncbi:MAG: flavodoxin family protein [Christensenellales bacterium]
MKKILILEGSPRKNGNTGILSGQFAKGAEQAGGCVEKIRVAEKKVSGCLGCGACEKNGGACIQKDDMEEIRAKMLAADSIVLASPIYFYSMTAQMKAVIDRTCALSAAGGKNISHRLRCTGRCYTEIMLAALRRFTSYVPNIGGGAVFGINAMEASEFAGRRRHGTGV